MSAWVDNTYRPILVAHATPKVDSFDWLRARLAESLESWLGWSSIVRFYLCHSWTERESMESDEHHWRGVFGQGSNDTISDSAYCTVLLATGSERGTAFSFEVNGGVYDPICSFGLPMFLLLLFLLSDRGLFISLIRGSSPFCPVSLWL
jgi:hypothetical protein